MFSIIRSRQIDKAAMLRLCGLGYSEGEARQLIAVLRDGWKDSPRWRRDEVVALAPDAYAAGLEGRDMHQFYRAAATLADTTLWPLERIARVLLRVAASGRLMVRDLLEFERLGVPEWLIDPDGAPITLRHRASTSQLIYDHVITSILDARGNRP